ncbi:MAG: ABC transporter ATP-binding protein [Acidobacteriota bacterium]
MTPARAAHAPAVQVRAATRRLAGRLVLDAVDLTVAPGSIVGLAGPNGAGKSSLLRAIGGRLRLDAGTILIGGLAAQAARRSGRLGVVPQDIALHAHLTVRENLALWATLAGTPRSEMAARVADGLEWAGLVERASARLDTLSGGMRRRVNLVAGILHRPTLVLLDEPTVGVDAESRARLYHLLRDLKNQGLGVLLVSHDLHEAAELCDEVALMAEGVVLARGGVATLVATLCGTQAELVVLAAPDVAGDAVLAHAGFVNDDAGVWSRSGDGSAGELAAVERWLVDAAVPVTELRLRRPTLAGALANAVRQSRQGTGAGA